MRSPPWVIGSLSLKAVEKGLSNPDSTSHALRFAGDAGSFGLVGTSEVKMRAPSL
jgi:hypothetical protein